MPNGNGTTPTTGGSTPGGSTTPVSGVATATVVVQLKPVSFQLSLHYMGHDRIAHDPATYRCKYQLVKEGAVPVAAFKPDPATAGGVVTVTPNPPVAGEEVTVEYRPQGRALDAKAKVRIHYGFNRWNPVLADADMESAPGVGWRMKVKLPENAQQIDVAFTDGGSVWDNNDFKDWHFPSRGAEPCRNDPPTNPVVLTAPIANVVRHEPPLATIPPAAKPVASGGDLSPPAVDEVFRLVILDNHGMKESESPGDNKPAAYQSNGWMPAICPAVPYRVVVKKFLGTPGRDLEEVDLTETLHLRVEIKDPVEEFDQNSGSRRKFSEQFFHKYNRAAGNADTTGVDNALATLGGKRETADSPGLKASRLLKKAPYNNTPVAAEAVAGANSVTYASLSAVAEDNKLAEIPLEIKDGVPPSGSATAKKNGVTDFAFLPPPLGGDNYRFLLSLKGGVGDAPDAAKDIREQKANGADVTLLDDQQKPIPKEACYTTGRCVIWRKVEFALQITCNNVVPGDIDWNVLKANYRRSFIELVPPITTVNLTWQQWKAAMETVFDPTDTYFTKGNPGIQADFGASLIPGVTTVAGDKFKLDGGNKQYAYPGDPDQWVHALTREIIKRSRGTLANPSGNDQKSYPEGMFMLFSKSTRNGANKIHDGTLGESIGDRVFYMFPSVPADPADTTDTCSHELGHALYLAHSFTDGKVMTFRNAATSTDETIGVSEGHDNGDIGDHDQHDSCRCLMSYISSMKIKDYPYEPCGVCNLVLRFYDKSLLQDNANYGSQLKGGLEPDVIWRYHTDSKFYDAVPDLAVGAVCHLVSFGKERPYPKGGTGLWRSRIGLSKLGAWTKAGAAVIAAPSATPPVIGVPAGDVSIAAIKKSGVNMAKVTGVTAGRVQITFTHAGQAKSVFLKVVP